MRGIEAHLKEYVALFGGLLIFKARSPIDLQGFIFPLPTSATFRSSSAPSRVSASSPPHQIQVSTRVDERRRHGVRRVRVPREDGRALRAVDQRLRREGPRWLPPALLRRRPRRRGARVEALTLREDRDRDRDRHRGGGGGREHRDRDDGKEKERSSRSRGKDAEKDRGKDGEKDRSKEAEKDRSRDRDSERDRRRERDSGRERRSSSRPERRRTEEEEMVRELQKERERSDRNRDYRDRDVR